MYSAKTASSSISGTCDSALRRDDATRVVQARDPEMSRSAARNADLAFAALTRSRGYGNRGCGGSGGFI